MTRDEVHLKSTAEFMLYDLQCLVSEMGIVEYKNVFYDGKDELISVKLRTAMLCDQLELIIPTARQALLEASVSLLKRAIRQCRHEIEIAAEWHMLFEDLEPIAIMEDECAVDSDDEDIMMDIIDDFTDRLMSISV